MGAGGDRILSVPMLGFFSLIPSGVKAGSVLSSAGCEPSCALAHQAHRDLALCPCKEHSRAARLGLHKCEGFPPSPDRVDVPYGNVCQAGLVLGSPSESDICARRQGTSLICVLGPLEIKDFSALRVT